MRTITIKPNKNGTKRIRIGNFIIRFDNTCCTGHQRLSVLKDARGLPNLQVMGKHKKQFRDWIIHIWETDDPNNE